MTTSSRPRSGRDAAKRYWVAHVQGADLAGLKEMGFVVLTPFLEDYVFLQVSDENAELIQPASRQGLEFLLSRNVMAEVTGRELARMVAKTTGRLKAGLRIRVVTGEVAGLEGEVLEIVDDAARCALESYHRVYERWLPLEVLLPA